MGLRPHSSNTCKWHNLLHYNMSAVVSLEITHLYTLSNWCSSDQCPKSGGLGPQLLSWNSTKVQLMRQSSQDSNQWAWSELLYLRRWWSPCLQELIWYWWDRWVWRYTVYTQGPWTGSIMAKADKALVYKRAFLTPLITKHYKNDSISITTLLELSVLWNALLTAL